MHSVPKIELFLFIAESKVQCVTPLKSQFGKRVVFLQYTGMENASLGTGGGPLSICFLEPKRPVPPQQLSVTWSITRAYGRP